MNKVLLVDENDREIGQMAKLEAHEKGVLHRAFSILLFNDNGDILLQQRAHHKYHSGGLWTNTCCSHPFPNEPVKEAVNRRLAEEMGIVATTNFAFKFIYKAKLDHNLTEHELDHVYTGEFNGTPNINSEEVNDWKWMHIDALKKDIVDSPQYYTAWLLKILHHVEFDKYHTSSS